jgi:citronellyl-CoA dehydrogenase
MSYSGNGGLGMGFAVQTDMVLPPVHLLGTEEQKHKYLVPAITGKKIGALGITEPGAGSDVAGIRTTAILDGDEYVINGSKTFITNAARAQFMVLVVKTDPSKAHDGITLLLIDIRDEDGNDLPGFSVTNNLEKMGMLSSDTGELAFEDFRVPAESVLGEVGKGFYHISWELQGERLVAAAGSHAGAERLLETTIEYALDRQAFGRPIGKFQSVANKVVDMKVRLDTCRPLVYRIGSAKNSLWPVWM